MSTYLQSVFYHVAYAFRMNLNSAIAWMLRKYLLGANTITETEVNETELETQTAQMIKLCCEYLSVWYIG